MDDVAAVASIVAADQVAQRRRRSSRRSRGGAPARRARTPARSCPARTGTARSRARRTGRGCPARTGPPGRPTVPATGIRKLLQQVLARRAPPGHQRPDAHQQQQRAQQRAGHLLEVRRPDADLLVGDGLGDQRVDRAPEDGERDAQEQQVVDQEARFARQQRVELVVGAQLRQPPEEQAQRAGDRPAPGRSGSTARWPTARRHAPTPGCRCARRTCRRCSGRTPP